MSSTRLLILGALRFLQPTHGYRIRSELESWSAENWANIAYGSIYHALKKMAEEGLVEATGTDRVDNRPARTTYAITEFGEAEFHRLLHEHWWEMKPVIDPFQVALSFMGDLPRDELISALRRRATAYRSAVEELEYSRRSKMMSDAPRHVNEIFNLAAAQAEASAQWADETIRKVERGDLP